MQKLKDLSSHYIIKKFMDGWFLGEIGSQETLFLSNRQLVEMGYIASDRVEPESIGFPPSIVIPVVSKEGRADLDTNWREKKFGKKCRVNAEPDEEQSRRLWS